MTTAAVYVRASLDKTGEGESVERQIEACGALAALRGYEVTTTHTDNDRSAKGHVTRPGFDALLQGIEAGRYEVVVATEYTRLSRNKRDELRLMEACQAARVSIALVRGQDMDLTSAAGRMTAEILASVARQEIEQMGERLSSGLRQRAERGRPHWSARPYGYTLSGDLVPEESDRLAQAYTDLLEGASLSQIGRDLTMPRGSVLKVLKSERNAGLRSYKGQVMGTASWPAIVDEATWQAACAVLADPSRDRGGRTPTYLLTGLAVGPTGDTVRTVKSHGKTTYTARGVSRQADAADNATVNQVLKVLSMKGARAVLTERESPDLIGLRTERATLVRRRDVELPGALAEGLSIPQVAAATRTINTRIGEIDAALLDDTRGVLFSHFWTDDQWPHWHAMRADMRPVWDAQPLHTRRAILAALCATVRVLPGRGVKHVIDIEWTSTAQRIVRTEGMEGWIE